MYKDSLFAELPEVDTAPKQPQATPLCGKLRCIPYGCMYRSINYVGRIEL